MSNAPSRLRPTLVLCFAVLAVAALGVNDTKGG